MLIPLTLLLVLNTQPRDAVPSYSASDARPPARVALQLGPRDEVRGQFTRELTPNEHAYFQAMRAQVVGAVKAAFAPAGWSCDGIGDDPRGPPEAMLGIDGFLPRDWVQGFFLQCFSKGAGMTSLSITPGAAWSLGPQEKESELLAADAIVRAHGLLKALVIGKREVPSATPSVQPGLASVGALEITFVGQIGVPVEVDEVLPKVDLAPVRELLAHPPRLPAAEGSSIAVPDEANPTRSELEAAVYRAALEEVVGSRRDTKQVLVSARGGGTPLGHGITALATAGCPELRASAFADYDRHAHEPAPFPAGFTWRLPVVPLTAAEEQTYFPAKPKPGVDGWKALREKYPGATGIVSFSRVGLSRERDQAIVAVTQRADWLAASGETWFLVHTAGGWRVTYKLRRWVS